jgi:hypothetical protein
MGNNHFPELVVGRCPCRYSGKYKVEGILWRGNSGTVAHRSHALVDGQFLIRGIKHDERFTILPVSSKVTVKFEAVIVMIFYTAIVLQIIRFAKI